MRAFHRNALIASTAIVSVLASTPAAAQTKSFDVPAQSVQAAVSQLGRQADIQIIAARSVTRGARSAPVRGNMTVEQALSTMLEGTGLTFRLVGSQTYTIVAVKPSKANATGQASDSAGEPNAADAAVDDESANREILVTGTRIRGREPTGAEIVTLGRGEFDRTGSATVEDALRNQPQAFASSQRSQIASNGLTNNNTFDASAGSAINLRGLGVGSTLTLVNGRRLARGGGQQVIDTSIIPLAAVERIDILLDGASAIYGSDAIAGVVNLITRRDFNGGETRLQTGISSRSDAPRFQGTQSLGISGSRGYAFASYNYLRQDSYQASARPNSRALNYLYDAAPTNRAHSAYGAGEYSITDAFRVNGSISYSNRDTELRTFFPLASLTFADAISVESLGGTLGTTFQISPDLRFEVNGIYGESRARRTTALNGTPAGRDGYTSKIYSGEAVLSGDLFEWYAGGIGFVVGGAARRETYFGIYSPANYSDEDESWALFGELSVPLLRGFGDSQNPRATLSLAGRYESYDTWGSTFDPKIGLNFMLTPDLRLRGTYGTSFRAPTVVQRTPFNRVYTPATIPNTNIRILQLGGNNPDLGPETSRNLSLGFDFRPRWLSGFSLAATYFNIKFSNVIQTPGYSIFTVLSDPDYARLVRTRDQVGAGFNDLVSSYLLTPGAARFNCVPPSGPDGTCREPPSNFSAIIDGRLQNLTGLATSGLDVALSYGIVTGQDSWQTAVNATYIADYKIRSSPGGAAVEFVNANYRPIALRLSGSLNWQRGPISAGVNLNYADSYTNRAVTPNERIGSFTTTDMNVQFRLSPSSFVRRGAKIIFQVNNLFDADPPFVRDPFNASLGRSINYDPSNADPMGRYFSVTFVGNW